MATRNANETDAQIGRCNSRFNILDGKLDALASWKGRADMEIETALGGVSNFREFQSEARDFFSRSDERAKTEKAFHEKRDQEIKEAVNKHNWRIMLAVALVGLVLAAMQWWIDKRNHRPDGSFIRPPSITAPKTTGQTYNAHNDNHQLAGKEW